jgi:hypothetical protein
MSKMSRRTWMRTAMAAPIGAAALSAGCGYALAGRGSFLPAYITTIGIPQFGNLTPYEIIERPFTESVRSEFIGRGRYTVLPQDTGVDALLKGDIIGLSITPAAFNDQQQASRYTITVVARMEFRDLKSNNVLWENPSLVYREEYDSAQGTSALDPNAFFGQEADALRRVSSEFARSVVSSILEAF